MSNKPAFKQIISLASVLALGYLASGCAIAEDACEASLFEVRYSRFIAFRDAGVPDALVANAFAAIVPHSRDGAVLLVQSDGRWAGMLVPPMAPHGPNVPQVLFTSVVWRRCR